MPVTDYYTVMPTEGAGSYTQIIQLITAFLGGGNTPALSTRDSFAVSALPMITSFEKECKTWFLTLTCHIDNQIRPIV